MKISSEYIIRDIAGDYIIVPIGQAAFDFQGLITVNEIGVYIWKLLQENEMSFNDLILNILDEYDVSREIAIKDTIEFLNQLIKHKILIEKDKIIEESINEEKI